MQAAPPVAAPMVVSTIQTPQRKEHYMSKAVLGLSVTQITTGALCILFQGVLIGIKSPIHSVGQGIWTGVFFILAGSFGIVSSRRKTTCFIVTFLILSIMSAVITAGIFLTSPHAIIDSYNSYWDSSHSMRTVVGIHGVLLILAVVEAVMGMMSSVFSCHGLCCEPVVVAGQVQYVQGPDGQQQMVILPFNQQVAALPAGAKFRAIDDPPPPYDQVPPLTYEGDTQLLIPE